LEGCCWWGRGALLTRGVCNIGKLDYYLGKRAYVERGEGKFPTIDFCADPELTCASEASAAGAEERRWITGFFEWVERIQMYPAWDYISNLRNYVDQGMRDDSFIDTVSSIFTRGCHSPDCSFLEVTMREKRKQNFKKVLDIFGLPRPISPPTPGPTRKPSAPSVTSSPPVYIMPPSLALSQPGQPKWQPTNQNAKPTVRPAPFPNGYAPPIGPPQPAMPIMPPSNENTGIGPMQPATPMVITPPDEYDVTGPSQPAKPIMAPSNENNEIGLTHPSISMVMPPSNENAVMGPMQPATPTIVAPSNENHVMGPRQPATPTFTPPLFSETERPTRKKPGNRPDSKLVLVEDNLAHLLDISWWTIPLTITIWAFYL